MKYYILFVLLFLFPFSSFGASANIKKFTLVSNSGALSFPEAQVFDKYGCTGKNQSPRISWTNPPVGTKSFALILEDIDAPGGSWIHWISWNIPKNYTYLNEGISSNKTLFKGKQGKNDYGNIGYGGPCPPPGSTHRYILTIYALNITTLGLETSTSTASIRSTFLKNMLGKNSITLIYKR